MRQRSRQLTGVVLTSRICNKGNRGWVERGLVPGRPANTHALNLEADWQPREKGECRSPEQNRSGPLHPHAKCARKKMPAHPTSARPRLESQFLEGLEARGGAQGPSAVKIATRRGCGVRRLWVVINNKVDAKTDWRVAHCVWISGQMSVRRYSFIVSNDAEIHLAGRVCFEIESRGF